MTLRSENENKKCPYVVKPNDSNNEKEAAHKIQCLDISNREEEKEERTPKTVCLTPYDSYSDAVKRKDISEKKEETTPNSSCFLGLTKIINSQLLASHYS